MTAAFALLANPLESRGEECPFLLRPTVIRRGASAGWLGFAPHLTALLAGDVPRAVAPLAQPSDEVR